MHIIEMSMLLSLKMCEMPAVNVREHMINVFKVNVGEISSMECCL